MYISPESLVTDDHNSEVILNVKQTQLIGTVSRESVIIVKGKQKDIKCNIFRITFKIYLHFQIKYHNFVWVSIIEL